MLIKLNNMFRINLYLSVKVFLKSLFTNCSNYKELKIKQIIKNSSKKKYILFTSLCRVSFMLILMFIKKKNKTKNQIIVSPYNLPEMINVAKNLNFKIVYLDINHKTGFFDPKDLLKKINKKTCSVLLTNMFNNFKDSKKIKKICSRKKIYLIEDNAIYFDNFSNFQKKKIYSGFLGDFSIYSFNIMKNISALYGGAVVTNINDFYQFANKEINKFNSFPKSLILKQSIIFFILKIMSINLLYKLFFFNLIKIVHKKKILFFLKLFYPSLKFRKISFPNYYFTKISNLSKNLIYYQLIDIDNRLKNFNERKKKNMYFYNSIKKINSKNIQLLEIKDFNYQNFIDFPIIVNDRYNLNQYLLRKGIETRIYYYNNCERIFSNKKTTLSKNSSIYENKIICLPNHKKISFQYIDYIVTCISSFYIANKTEN